MTTFEAVKVTERVYWVGAIDDEIRNFHGYSTSRGTTYNAFLIMGKEPILVDTVKRPFYDEMMARIASVIPPESISYIISNHAEMDHSGCLIDAIKAINPKQVFASKMGHKALKAHFHVDMPITEIVSGEPIMLGDANFSFFETRMLHWPDSMMTFFEDDGILFSQDGFGMHLAVRELFASEQDRSILRYEAAKYFANILLPYSNFVTRLLAQFPSFGFDVKIIAPDHGPLWQGEKEINWILSLWQTWAEQKPTDKAVILYDSMWGSTAKMAKVIADAMVDAGARAKLMNLSISHRSDVAVELLEAGALLAGSPTINQQIFPTLADTCCYLQGLKRQHLIGQAFGSYGWGGESITLLQTLLKDGLKVELLGEPVKSLYVPDDAVLLRCRELGKRMAEQLIQQVG